MCRLSVKILAIFAQHMIHTFQSSNKMSRNVCNDSLWLCILLMAFGMLYSCGVEVSHHQIVNNTLVLSEYNNAGQTGNFLTMYYNSRGFAKYLGLCFKLDDKQKHKEPWINYLPNYVCPTPEVSEKVGIRGRIDQLKENLQLVEEICKTCQNFYYPHECKGFWNHMRDEMHTEITSAINKYAIETNIAPMRHMNNDTSVIYIRCQEHDSILRHAMYGPAGFSLYNDTRNSSEIIIVTGFRKYNSTTLCGDIEKAREEYLRMLNPTVKISYQDQSVMEDYRLLMNAPRVFLDLSTFGLVAGMANSKAHVYMPVLWGRFTVPFDNWTWSQAPVLIPKIGEDVLGLYCFKACYGKRSGRCWCNDGVNNGTQITPDELQRIIHWLKTN